MDSIIFITKKDIEEFDENYNITKFELKRNVALEIQPDKYFDTAFITSLKDENLNELFDKCKNSKVHIINNYKTKVQILKMKLIVLFYYSNIPFLYFSEREIDHKKLSWIVGVLEYKLKNE